MKVFISESARNQKWFDKLDVAKKKEYLAAHPKSKFGKAKPAINSSKEHKMHVSSLTGNRALKTKHGHSSVLDDSSAAAVKRRLTMHGYTKQDDGNYVHKDGRIAKFVKRGDAHKLHVSDPNTISSVQKNPVSVKPKTAPKKAKLVVHDKLKAELAKFKASTSPAAKKKSFERLKTLRAKI